MNLPTITLPPKPAGPTITREQVMALAMSTSGMTADEIETTPEGKLAWYCAARALRVERDGDIHDEPAKTEIEIATTQNDDGSFDWSFVLRGQTHYGHDFTTRERALEDARSSARCLFRGLPL